MRSYVVIMISITATTNIVQEEDSKKQTCTLEIREPDQDEAAIRGHMEELRNAVPSHVLVGFTLHPENVCDHSQLGASTKLVSSHLFGSLCKHLLVEQAELGSADDSNRLMRRERRVVSHG